MVHASHALERLNAEQVETLTHDARGQQRQQQPTRAHRLVCAEDGALLVELHKGVGQLVEIVAQHVRITLAHYGRDHFGKLQQLDGERILSPFVNAIIAPSSTSSSTPARRNMLLMRAYE